MGDDRVPLGLVWLKPGLARTLAGAMYGVQVMRRPGSRQSVLEWVKTQHQAFDPRRSDRDMEEINNFISACRADDESFDLLLEAIEVNTPGDDPNLAALKNLVDTQLLRAALTKEELRGLLALGPDQIVNAGQLAVGLRNAWPEHSSHERPRNVREGALFLLDCASAQEGLCRLLCFVEWLAGVASALRDPSYSTMAEQLRNWVHRVGGAHDVTPAAWRASAGSAHEGEPVLLIELQPTLRDRFAVYLWLCEPGAGPHTLKWDKDSCRLDELRGQLDEFLELASYELSQIEGRLRVQFLLDLEIFNQDVDWWLFGADEGYERPLGAEYEVTVRRHRTKERERLNWQTRWQALKQAQAAKPISELIVWVRDAATLTPTDLWTELDDDPTKILVAPLGTCAKLDSGMRNLLLLAFTQGMPVALGLRHAPTDAARHLDSLQTALGDAHLADLPELVRKWRKQAWRAFKSGNDHFGRYLVLLWDDYEPWLPGTRDKLALPTVKGAGQ